MPTKVSNASQSLNEYAKAEFIIAWTTSDVSHWVTIMHVTCIIDRLLWLRDCKRDPPSYCHYSGTWSNFTSCPNTHLMQTYKARQTPSEARCQTVLVLDTTLQYYDYYSLRCVVFWSLQQDLFKESHAFDISINKPSQVLPHNSAKALCNGVA